LELWVLNLGKMEITILSRLMSVIHPIQLILNGIWIVLKNSKKTGDSGPINFTASYYIPEKLMKE
jgi:hypothetical protein